MKTTTITLKTAPRTKTQAQKLASDLGMSLSAMVNGFLNSAIKTKRVEFNLNNEEPSDWAIQAMKEAEADRKAGRVISFKSPQDAVAYVGSLIKK